MSSICPELINNVSGCAYAFEHAHCVDMCTDVGAENKLA